MSYLREAKAKELKAELQARYERLAAAIEGKPSSHPDDDFQRGGYVWTDGGKVRMAVDDFKTVLAEVRKLLGNDK